ncbi:hypothetical protein TNCV_2213991 [Trichonephila clavipes]|nr:hypothetical protein TNCV_2213991 [Trichonephila clavipes]
MIRKKGYKPQHLKTTYCGEILLPQSGDKWRYLSYSWFAVRQTGCRKPQYGKEQPAKFFKARIEEMIQNDQRVTLEDVSAGTELW